MSALRQRMIKAMQMHGFSPRTHMSYLAAVRGLAKYTHRAPDALDGTDLKGYFEYLVTERKLAPASVKLAYNGIRFLYLDVLAWPALDLEVALPKRPQRIPQLLTRAEVAAILAACPDGRYRTMMTLCYGCGLRLSEVLAVRVADIDSERKLLRVEQGKGAKDRLVPLSPTLLDQLRAYWRLYRPSDWLFAGRTGEPLCPTGLQRAFTHAKRRAGVTKDGGIHGMRHAYATHQLAAGLGVERLQRLLGHANIQTTLRYVHWLPSAAEGAGDLDLIARLGGAMAESPSLRAVIRACFDDLEAADLNPRQWQVCRHILDCRTPALGGFALACDRCDDTPVLYHACRDRHCPRCQRRASMDWCMRQRAAVLPVTYHHLVFTLPHVLNGWVEVHPKEVYALLFETAWATLSAFGADPKRLDGQMGMTAVLHTWGQTLVRHVHLH